MKISIVRRLGLIGLTLVLMLATCCARQRTNDNSNDSAAPGHTTRDPANSDAPPKESVADQQTGGSADRHSATQTAVDDSARTPDEVVHQFYTWYLGELRAGGKPFKQKEG